MHPVGRSVLAPSKPSGNAPAAPQARQRLSTLQNLGPRAGSIPSETSIPAVAAIVLLVAISLAGCTAPPSAQGWEDGEDTAANVTHLEDRIAELNDRIAELQDRIADLEAAVPPGAANPDQVRFEEIADEPDRGLDYSRVPWGWDAVERLEQRDRITKNHLLTYPEKPYGAPGVALLDFDGDGDPDMVSSAAYRFPEEVDLERFERRYRGPFDPTAHVVELFETAEGGERWDGPWQPPHVPIEGGDLSVEINQGGHGNAGVQVRTVGAKGLIPDGQVNRDGIGAIVEVQPHGQAAAMRPVVGGSSYASQNSLQMTFGLGEAPNATVTVQWPGGTTNRLYDVQPGEAIVFPEIPCSIDTTSMTRSEYETCVADALDGLVAEDVLDDALRQRLEASALRAYGS